MTDAPRTWSFKEIDECRGDPKGTAFRGFKQLKNSFDEGRDFFLLEADGDGAEIAALKASGRLYPSTVNAVLLSETGYAAILDYLDD